MKRALPKDPQSPQHTPKRRKRLSITFKYNKETKQLSAKSHHKRTPTNALCTARAPRTHATDFASPYQAPSAAPAPPAAIIDTSAHSVSSRPGTMGVPPSSMGEPAADIWNLMDIWMLFWIWIFVCVGCIVLDICGDYGGDGVYYKIPSGILCGVHMDRDIATMKEAPHLLWILEGIFDCGFYVVSRGPNCTKLSGPGRRTA